MRFLVEGNSMEPTVKKYERVLVFGWAYLFYAPKTGDLVVVLDPRDGERKLLKRITRVDGEGLWIEGDNRQSSADSQIFGPVAKDRILGRVVLCY